MFCCTCVIFVWIDWDRFPDLFDPWAVGTDDARQWVGPLWIHHNPALLDGDRMTAYMRALTPDGYEWLYVIFSRLDPVLYSKALSLCLLFLTLVLVYLAAVRISRSFLAGAAAVALALVFWGLPNDTAGGLPRSFAPPLLAACAWALAADRRWLLASLPVLSGLVYPPMALVTGGVLALRCIEVGSRPLAEIIRRAPDRNQLAVLGGAGLLSLLVVVSDVLEARDYGTRIDATSQVDQAAFPEHGGRYPAYRIYNTSSGEVFKDFILRYQVPRLQALAVALTGTPIPFVCALLVVLLLGVGVGGVLLFVSGAKPLLLLPISAGASGVLAILCYPSLYYPSRYLHMPLAVLTVIAIPLIPAAAVGWRRRFASRLRIVPAVMNLLFVGLAAGSASASQDVGRLAVTDTVMREPWRQTYHYLNRLPPDAMIAGWRRVADSIVLITGRSVLIGEVDMYHRDHVLEVRRRIRALIEAYFSPRHRDLLALRDEFGVTHLVIDSAHFFEDAPSFFEPYQTWARRRWAQVRDSGAEPAAVRCRTDAAAVVHDDGRFFILDLRAAPDAGCRGRDERP